MRVLRRAWEGAGEEGGAGGGCEEEGREGVEVEGGAEEGGGGWAEEVGVVVAEGEFGEGGGEVGEDLVEVG